MSPACSLSASLTGSQPSDSEYECERSARHAPRATRSVHHAPRATRHSVRAAPLPVPRHTPRRHGRTRSGAG
eukprot:6996779-Prymnesium_polylepis.2